MYFCTFVQKHLVFFSTYIMVYRRRRRYSRKRRCPKQYGYFGKAGHHASIGLKAAKMAGKALAMLNTEEKVFQLSATTTPTVATASVDPLFYPAQGTNNTERIGNNCKVTTIAIRAHLALDPLSPTNYETIRILLVKDNQSNGVQALLTDVIQSNTVIALRTLGKSKRFDVLVDRTVTLSSNRNPAQMTEIYKKYVFNPQFNGNTGTVADIQQGNLFLITMSTHSGANPPTIVYNSRIRFIDN